MADIRNPLTAVIDDTYSDEERRFLVAMDRYKRVNRRPYPTWREVFHVILSLGYRVSAESTDLPTFVRGGAQREGLTNTNYRGPKPDTAIIIFREEHK